MDQGGMQFRKVSGDHGVQVALMSQARAA